MSIRLLLLVPVLFLATISVTMLLSIAPHQVFSQLFSFLLGIGILLLVSKLRANALLRSSPYFYGAIIAGLFFTFILGKISHGAIRWIPLGPIHIQISEFAKPVVVLLLVRFIQNTSLRTHKGLLGFFVLLMLPMGLVFLQPDLGSAMVIGVTALIVLLFSDVRLGVIVPWILFGAISVFLVWNFALYPYQKDRIQTFVTGQKASPMKNYNARQALVSVGSGEFTGRGLGHGIESNLKFLPERYTDFIFASLAEELGFVGVAVVLLLYALLFASLFSLSGNTTGIAVICGSAIAFSLFFQMLINIGMNIGLFPITGIPLPLLSAGGSSIVSVCFSIGVVISFSRLKNLEKYAIGVH